MKNLYSWTKTVALLFAVAAMAIPNSALAQLSMVTPSVATVITFDATIAGVNNGQYAGSGMQATPAVGQLDSDAWAHTGMSDGARAFGATGTTGDFARGVSGGGVTTGGFYGFTVAGGNRAFGIQPGGSDWAPGTATLRTVNNTGAVVNIVDIAYLVYVFNDQARGNSFNFSWSTDNVTYTPVGALDLTSTTAAGAAAWVSNSRSTSITGLTLAIGASFYLRWNGDDVNGSGGRDEFALDNVSVTMSPNPTNTSVQFVSTGSSIAENGGPTNLALAITNPGPVNPTNVTITATGATGRVTSFTSPVIFPPVLTGNQNCVVVLNDDALCIGAEDVTFTITAVTGGGGAPVIGTNNAHTLTVTEDDGSNGILAFQGFDGTGNDDWTISAGAGNISSDPGAGDTPANERILNGTSSWQVNNTTATLDLATITTTGSENVVVRARLSSTSGTSGNGADAADLIDVYVNLDGAGFPGTPDIRINGFSNTRYGYSTGSPSTATTTAGTPITLTTAADDYTFIEVLIPNGTNSVALRLIGDNNSADEYWNFDNVSISGDVCKTVYYSRGSGDVTGNIWSTTRAGAAAAVTFGRNTDMVIQSGDVVDLSTTEQVCQFYVESGGQFNGETTGDMTSYGDTLSAVGILGGDDGDWNWSIYAPTGGTWLGGAGSPEFGRLHVLGGGIVELNTSTIDIVQELTIGDGSTFDANSNSVTLLSDATGTARIGDLSNGSYTNAPATTIQRFIPAGETDWRLLGSSMSGRILASWNDDFITAGFIGSDVPWFDSPVGSGILWPSVRTYDETFNSAVLLDTLRGPTGTGQALTPGQGFAVWCGDNLDSTLSFVIDNSGPISVGPVVLPMTYTSTGNPTIDGHNLVSNPLPSPIDFSLITLGADVDNFYHVYNPSTGSNATWDEVLGTSVPVDTLNGNIQSMQGFWLKATGAGVTTTVEESDKVLEPLDGGLFGGTSDMTATLPVFRLRINGTTNGKMDEALVVFDLGNDIYGPGDITKFTFVDTEAPQISTESSDGQDLVINKWGAYTNDISIPVRVSVPANGDYTITMFNAQNLLGQSCLVLEDLQTSISTPLVEGATYTFTANASDAVTPARFVVHVSEPITRTATDVTCANANDGFATVLGAGAGPWDVTWMDAAGNVLLQQPQVTGLATFSGLQGGDYMVSVSGNGTCGVITNNFTIDEPAVLDAISSAINEASCAADADGDIFVETMGGTDPYTYLWSNGAITEDLLDVAAGTYDLSITDGSGCTTQLTGLEILAGDGPTALFSATTTTVFTDEEIEFYPVYVPNATYTWDLGDGTTSTGFDLVHEYLLPGTYTVTLVVTLENCSNTFDITMNVTTSTGVGVATIEGLQAHTGVDAFIITWDMESNTGTQMQLFDAMGRAITASELLPGTTGTTRISTTDLVNGMYMLRFISGERSQTFTLPHFGK